MSEHSPWRDMTPAEWDAAAAAARDARLPEPCCDEHAQDSADMDLGAAWREAEALCDQVSLVGPNQSGRYIAEARGPENYGRRIIAVASSRQSPAVALRELAKRLRGE